ncbi:MAG TPA: peptidase M61 [Ignavibacteria bacterium]|nr:peptidase M61 [Ignavibacteria bacterium]HMR41807.1 peptidase M61 [Ignavibacteria bacterium]
MYRLLILPFLFISIFSFSNSYSQTNQNESYQYYIDLNKAENGKLSVELITPDFSSSSVLFRFPAMVPGTYKVYDFGRFVSDLKAMDESGNELSVSKQDENTWEISGAESLYKITYMLKQTFGDTTGKTVFEPVGTSFEPGKIFVFNNQGIFGYFDGYLENDYILNVTKPEGFYGSTSLDAIERTNTLEVFNSPGYAFLVDNPIFFNVPDTASIIFPEAKVLISVYSPGKGITAKDIQQDDKTLLEAIRNFLGGKLPTDRYTFLYYFTADMKGSGMFGALEHNNSSMYYFPDVPVQAKSFMLSQLESTTAHEFYHVVTPLNLHSEEIGFFDFNNPVMSQHLWLYEGVTEYNADYIQLVEGLMTMEEYGKIVQQKMDGASRYNDTLPFTFMSRNALTPEYEDQYINVYQKGALIGMCLDILIREESNGQQSLQDVINKLIQKYGKNNPFKDDELFGEIEALTSPKIREFLDTYVAGPNKIPYNEIFAKVGFNIEKIPYEAANTSGLAMGFNQETYRLKVVNTGPAGNKFMEDLGIKIGDELVSVNGVAITFQNARGIFGSQKNKIKIGDELVIEVARPQAGGSYDNIKLKATVKETSTKYDYKLSINEDLNAEQKKIQQAWLGK